MVLAHRPFQGVPRCWGVADALAVLQALFTTLLVLNLVLMVLNTYFLSRKPILFHLKEIYFINSASFKRAWYLVIAAMTLFIMARAVNGYQLARGAMPLDQVLIFDVAFAALVLAAFLELVFVFSKYLPYLGADDAVVQAAIRGDLRRSVLRLDDLDALDVDVSIAEDIYQGRRTLGPQVSLSHYRAVVLGLAQYMEHRFGELGDAMFYSVGRQTGRQAAAGMVSDQNARPLLEEFLLAIRTSAVGIPSIVQDTGSRITVRLDECAVCAGIRPTGTEECHYLTGVFTGLIETAWGVPVEAHEVRCHAKGDLFCEFQIDKT